MNNGPDATILPSLINSRMPYGKYKDRPLYQLPMAYLEWMKRTGFPKGRLGIQLETLFEIKLNGLEYILQPLIEAARK